MTWSMMPCSPAMMFCSIVGQASRQTAGPIGPSTMERSKRCAGFDTGTATTGPDSGTGDAPAAIAASVSSKQTPPRCQPSAFFGNSDHFADHFNLRLADDHGFGLATPG